MISLWGIDNRIYGCYPVAIAGRRSSPGSFNYGRWEMRRQDLWIFIVAAFLLAGLIIIAFSFDPPSVLIPEFEYVNTTPRILHNWTPN
jgi:hypothetical protein